MLDPLHNATPASPLASSPFRLSLLGTSRQDLLRLMAEASEPPWRAGSLFRWIHHRRARSFDEMTDLPLALRHSLSHRFSLERPRPVERHAAPDGTTKWALALTDGEVIESVFLRDGRRTTLCLSSQAGCRFGCSFCATARMGLRRNLDAAEIVGQALALAEGHAMPSGAPFNVVFMGMGEPMDNLDAVLAAFEILTGADGFGLSWRRVTVSTVGHLPGIRRLARLVRRPRLAISLNATSDAARGALMPVNRRWPLAELRQELASFPVRAGERITFEYVLLAGENDSGADAARLATFLAGLPARLNLIPWNEIPGSPYRRPGDEDIEAFRDALLSRGVDTAIRFSRGREVAAACGQLATFLPRPEPGGTPP